MEPWQIRECDLCKKSRPTIRLEILTIHRAPQFDSVSACRKCIWIYTWSLHHAGPVLMQSSRHGWSSEITGNDYIVPDDIEVNVEFSPPGVCKFGEYIIGYPDMRLSLLPRDMLRAVLLPYIPCDMHCWGINTVRIGELTDKSPRDCTGGIHRHTYGLAHIHRFAVCNNHLELFSQLEYDREICDGSHRTCRL